MTRRITLIRHAETEANVSGGWQGQTDSPITDRGLAQIGLLGGRFDAPDLLVSSDLDRAVATAEAIGVVEPDPMWRELDFGAWEGLTQKEIRRRFSSELEAMRSGLDFAPERGERLSAFAERIQQAFASVAARLSDGDEAIVVTHGGVIHSLVAATLAVGDRSALVLPANTSATTIALDGTRRPEVFVYNDASHLGSDTPPSRGRTVVLFRHAETEANREHRWHGRGETPLTDLGRRQAADLAATAMPLDHIATSPLSRARETADPVAAAQGREVGVFEGLAEIHFGEWEGMTVDEIRAVDESAFDRIYESGLDEARGGTGETFGEAGERLAATVEEITIDTDADPIGIFTHGGVARAYVSGLLGIAFADRHALPVLRNTARAEISIEPSRARMASYNVAPHLET
jgi:broad specificity phosphatase PhoE